MQEHHVALVLDFILERVTNIAMGTEINEMNEFEDIACLIRNSRWETALFP